MEKPDAPPLWNRLRKPKGGGIFFSMNENQGSAGNVIAAVCSFFFPGLGQLVQGRVLSALLFFVGAAVVWFISFGMLGWTIHIWSCINAALWTSRRM
jgi:TM2 domain-containing membrane protein YozV